MADNNAATFLMLVFIIITIFGSYAVIYYIDQLTVSGKASSAQGTVNITINGFCGDSLVLAADNETCESNNLNGETCATLGFDSGTLKCATDCRSFDTSGCVRAAVTAVTAVGRTGVSERPFNITVIYASLVYSVTVNKFYPVYIVYGKETYRLNVEIAGDRVKLRINPGDIRIDTIKSLEYGVDLNQDGKDDIVVVLDEVLERRAVYRLWTVKLREPIRPRAEVPKEAGEELPILVSIEKVKVDKVLFIIFLVILILSIIIYKRKKH